MNIAGACCYRPGDRPRFVFKLLVWHGRKGEPKSLSWTDYRDLIIATHQLLDAPLVWVWDNLNIHLQAQLKEFADAHDDWLKVFYLPAYAPELNPVEGMWSHLKRSIAGFLAPTLAHLVRIIKRKLKKLQYRPDVIRGCLTTTGLTINPQPTTRDPTSST